MNFECPECGNYRIEGVLCGATVVTRTFFLNSDFLPL